MDKASKALRRSGVRLKSMSSGHQELNMVISQLRDVRSTAKAFLTAQNTASQDMLKWSLSEENRAIQDTFVQLSELNALWTEVQKEFTDHLKAFAAQFEMILEGEHQLDQTRAHVTTCEMKAVKIRKDFRKVSRQGNAAETQQLEIKLDQAENSFVQAQHEVFSNWPPKVRPYRQYTNDNLWAALMAVKCGGSVYRASKEHGIPRKTLRNWMKRWNIKSKYAAPIRKAD